MQTKIQKWGNNQGLRLNKELLQSAGFKTGDEVEIKLEGSTLVIMPARKIRLSALIVSRGYNMDLSFIHELRNHRYLLKGLRD